MELVKKYGWIIAPLPWLVYKTFSPEISNEKQVEAAINLIKAGKENGAKKMRIKLKSDAGIKLGAMLKGLPLNIDLGNQGFIEFDIDFDNISSSDLANL